MLTLLFVFLGLSGIIASYIWAYTGSHRYQPSLISGIVTIIGFHCLTTIILSLSMKRELTYVNILALLVYGSLSLVTGFVLGTEGNYRFKHELIVSNVVAMLFVAVIFLTHN